MSNHIGRASILLTADTASFESEIVRARDTAQGALGDIRQQAMDMGQALKTGVAMGTVALGALSATVGVAVKEQMELVNALNSVAMRANTTAAEIQKYTFAAKAMGIEQDKLGDIFKDTQDKIGDFLTTEGGELKDFFDNVAPRVGITTEKLREMSGPDALQAIYNGLDKANIGQAEMVFYMESIADEASLLIPLLKNGGEGFKIWEEAARNAGAVMDEKTIRATQELNASTKLLELTYQGAKNQFTQAVIPVLSDMAGKLVGNANAANTAKAAGEGLVTGLKVVAKVGLGVASVFQVMGEAIGGFSAGVATFFSALDTKDPLSFIMSLGKASTAAAHVLDDMIENIDKRLQSAANTMADIDRLGTGATNATVAKVMSITQEQEEIKKLGITGAEQAKAREATKEATKEKEKAKAKSEKDKLSQSFKLNPNDPNSLKLGIYLAYLNAGLNHKQATTITAEVGRENDFDPRYIFGYHNDLNQKGVRRVNVGMLSWNGGRGLALEKQLKTQGHLKNGMMSRTQENLNAQARFSVAEMKSNDYRGRLKNFWNNPNADHETIAKEMGGKNGYVGWAMYQNTVDGKPFDWLKHHNKRKRYAEQLDKLGRSYQSGVGFNKVNLDNALSDIKQDEKDFQEAQRIAQKEADARLAIQKYYADEKAKALHELTEKQKAIQEANFNKDEHDKYMKLAEDWYQNKIDLIDLARDKQKHAATEHLKTEEQRIVDTADLERRTVALTLDMSEELRKAKIDAITHAENNALSALRLEQDKAWQAVNEQYQTEEERIKANAELERRTIMATVGMDEKLREAKIKAVTDTEIKALDDIKSAYRNELDELTSHNKTELQKLRDEFENKRYALNERTDISSEQKWKLSNAMDGQEIHAVKSLQDQARKDKSMFYAEMGGVSELQNIKNQHQARLDTIKGFLDAEVMTVEEAEKAKQLIRMQYAQDTLGVLSESSKAAFGEQSKAYQMMFAMQKGMAIAQASMALWQNISEASKIGFPQNIPMITQAMAQGMGIIANIRAIKNTVVGQAHDGIMSVPKSGTWNLEKGERVLPRHTAQNLDNTLNRLQGRGETKVIINNYTSEKAQVQQLPNGDMIVTIGKMIDAKVDAKVNQRFLQARRQGGELYGR